MNRNYAKIISKNRIGYAPDSVVIGNKVYREPTAEQYAQVGYYPVCDTPQPDGLFWDYEWQMSKKKDAEQVVRVWSELPDTRTPEEQRKYAYETRKSIEYNKNMLTVDEAITICLKYLFEETDKAKEIIAELSQKITEAKEAIRKEYPDEEEPKDEEPKEEEPKDEPKDDEKDGKK